MSWACALCESTLAGLSVTRSQTDRGICTWCEEQLAKTGKRRCRTCNQKKSPDAFNVGWVTCRPCRKQMDAVWRAKNHEQDLARKRAYTVRNRETINARARAKYDAAKSIEHHRDYYERNGPQVRTKNLAYYHAHRDELLARKREQRAANRIAQKRSRDRAKVRVLQQIRGG